MTERLDAVLLRKYTDSATGEQKSASTRIGVAWALSGGGYRLELEAVPVPTIYEGKIQCSIMLFPPKDRDNQPQPSRGYGAEKGRVSSTAPAFDSADDDHGIPF